MGSGFGEVEVATNEGAFTRVSGWAVDAVTDRPVRNLVATVGERVVSEWFPTTARIDTEQRFGRRTRPSGFWFDVPNASLTGEPVRVFAISDDGRAFPLASLTPQVLDEGRMTQEVPSGAADVEGADGPMLGKIADNTLTLDGRPYSISERIAGSVESVTTISHGYRAAGWAVDKRANLPAFAVVAARGDTVVAKARPSLDRADIAAGIAPGGRKSGFVIDIPSRGRTLSRSEPVRLFGLMADGTAIPLASAFAQTTAGAFVDVPFGTSD